MGGNNLAGINLAGQNLTNASFSGSTLSNANLSQANLTNAILSWGGTADRHGSDRGRIRGATSPNTACRGITLAQLYSTASYQAHDLTGIRLATTI